MIETDLDTTGEAPGRLHGRFPSVDGDWFGVVNYEIGYADGRPQKMYLVDQLMPFHVLRLRDPDQAAVTGEARPDESPSDWLVRWRRSRPHAPVRRLPRT
ncbi:hypothetical protein [Lentzea sp. NPDC055074]